MTWTFNILYYVAIAAVALMAFLSLKETIIYFVKNKFAIKTETGPIEAVAEAAAEAKAKMEAIANEINFKNKQKENQRIIKELEILQKNVKELQRLQKQDAKDNIPVVYVKPPSYMNPHYRKMIQQYPNLGVPGALWEIPPLVEEQSNIRVQVTQLKTYKPRMSLRRKNLNKAVSKLQKKVRNEPNVCPLNIQSEDHQEE